MKSQKSKVKSKNIGLTLIEILVAMGIASIAGVLLLVIIVNSMGIFSQQSSKVSEGLNMNDAFSKMRGVIKQSSMVAQQYTEGSTTYTSGVNQLVLKIPSIDSSNNIIDLTFDYLIFYLDQNYLHLKTLPYSLSSRKSGDQILSTNVDSLVFKYLNSANPPAEVIPIDATKIRITIQLKQKINLGFETAIATSEANLLND